MRYKFYTTSIKAWDGIWSALNQAQQSIFIEMYIFLDDTNQTHNFLGKLKEKALAGLKVIVIVDAYGSINLKSNIVNELRTAGVEFIFFSRWLKRTHRKLILIDEKIAFLGGVNIYKKISHWRDLHVKVQGKVVRPLLRSFAKTYHRCGGRDETVLVYAKMNVVKKIKAWILDSWNSADNDYNFKHYYQQKIINAQQTIDILTPYLLPPRWLLAALDNAVKRGVTVSIIIPHDTDIKVLNRINYINACRLADVGVRFYFGKEMNHAKAMIIDNKEAIVGSQNLDLLSFGMNLEIGVFFSHKQAVETLANIFKTWKQEAVEMDLGFKKLKFFDRIFAFVLRRFVNFF
jgi:cardiolipin synthase